VSPYTENNLHHSWDSKVQSELWPNMCTSVTSVHRSSLFPFVLGFVLLTTTTWLCHVLGLRVMVRAVSASRHLRFGTCCHLIWRTVMLVANSSSRALRLGSLCKPTHKRRLWELCLSGALQILDLIDWLIDIAISGCRSLSQSSVDTICVSLSSPW